MIVRSRRMSSHNREGFVSYIREGSVYLEPPAPPKFKRIKNSGLLSLAETAGQSALDPIRPVFVRFSSNWLRWLVFSFMSQSARRRQILEHI